MRRNSEVEATTRSGPAGAAGSARRRRARGVAALVALGALSAAACKKPGNTEVAGKRAYACAEVLDDDPHEEADLGAGRALIRSGAHAEVRGLPEAPIVVVTSFDQGAAPLSLSREGEALPPIDVAFVVGADALERGPLTVALQSMLHAGELVVVVAGPEDDLDAVRGAVADAGKQVVDGSAVRDFVVGGAELLTLPGSDDPSTLPAHGRGCLLRAEDVAALVHKVGPAQPPRPRIAIVWEAPSRSIAHPAAADAIVDASAWLVAGPLDVDAPASVKLVAGVAAPLLPIPRARVARTTSTPGVIAAGAILVRAPSDGLELLRLDRAP